MADFLELKREALEKHLKQATQAEVRFDFPSRRLYSTDASIYQIEPLGVVLPRSVEDLRTVVQITAEHRLPLVPRGGGTSLSGQAIGAGVVIDCSKYLNRILDIDAAGRKARVEPGVILDQLNLALSPHGLQFGPDVATANRANLGGMIGNNSAGSRSIVYGKTLDHVLGLRVVLSDGAWAGLTPLTPQEWEQKTRTGGIEGAIFSRVRDIVLHHADEIHQRFPKILRRVSGYNLDALLDQLEPTGEHARRLEPPGEHARRRVFEPPGFMPRGASLSSLIVGSEGTLAFVGEAELNLVPRPKHRGLLVPHFDSLAAALEALAICLELQPSAVELLDQMILDLARENLALKRQMAAVHGRPAALLMVEFSSDDSADVEDRLSKLEHRLQAARGLAACSKATDAPTRDSLWNLRSAGVPLLLGVPGDRKPVTFVEDTAVAPEKLPEFVARFREILRRHGTDGSYYGHASVGCLHIRPVLNLKDAGDVARMRQISEEVSSLVLEYGGALSGEHGDGLARSQWNRKMFGDVLYQAFRDVKRAFDPLNLFNPGKVVEAPAMTENLRYGPDYRPQPPAVEFDYTRQEGFVRSIELCNGSGVCRKLKGGAMCPSFRATRDEKDSTRGRANALRLALTSEQPLTELRSEWVHGVLDLCLMCKACKAECPSNVDLAKLKAEFLHQYHQSKPRPRGQRLLARVYRLNRLGSALAPFSNWLNRRGVVRWLLERLAGVDRRRSLPRFHRNHLRRWFPRRPRDPRAGEAGRVLLLDDCFTTFNEPKVGRAAVRVLERAGFAVELAGLVCCARPLISKGFLTEAKALISSQAQALVGRLPYGMPILGVEPSCLLTLVDEWPELVPGEETRRIAESAELADGWLARQVRNGLCELPLSPLAGSCLLHGHCHQQALVGVGGTTEALQLVPGLDVQQLDAGCCGMAGSFGYEKEHYDLSVAIARLALLPALDECPEALVVAPGTSCRHQIKDLATRSAKHPLEVLEELLV